MDNAGDFLAIEAAIRETHECGTSYLGSRKVTHTVRGKVAWEGVVDVFRLVGHPKAKRCYAWQYREGDETKTRIILEIAPVVSAETAVKAALTGR